ncbi:hypothetical protein PQU92_10670 [Asticcacaulis sp. BYS171W]|uniref:Uncharacterized protein n=1 Tax=Asticcacaulis aquaticus TaxID=2984212 RepID=A0ABT5HUK0_9CAUL|nr:hypothetical protein [Asticcacaulis aquaticus]MDC7683741.1 hypothetical protein [Asticcacaulis aquaticus]
MIALDDRPSQDLETAVAARSGPVFVLKGPVDADALQGAGTRNLVMPIAAPANRAEVSNIACRIPQALRLLDAMATGDTSYRLCVLIAQADDPLTHSLAALSETLIRYGTGHLTMRPVQVNLLRYRTTPEGYLRAADMVSALFSGRLDGVCGQVFVLNDLGELPS